MHKVLTLKQLLELNNKMLFNLNKLYTSRKYTYFKAFIKDIFKESDSVYFFNWSHPTFRIIKEEDWNIKIFDEIEKIELSLNQDDINQVHNLLKNEKKLKTQIKSNKSILDTLFDSFSNWEFHTILDKPYIVYDIETTWNLSNLETVKFVMWYSFLSSDDEKKNWYKYISTNNLTKFVDFLINFDGYIVWYNNIYFDNPVVCYNLGYSQEKIDILNSKSLDLFLFIRNLTWKRIGLNKVSTSLVSLKKTLSSWLEWEELLKEYLKTGDEWLLSKVKRYCKNDVKMTLGVLLYFMKNKNINLDENSFEFEIDDLVRLWSQVRKTKDTKNDQKEIGNIFN